MSMDESTFYTDVQESASLGTVDAARATSRAVLTTLGERITIGEADEVGEQLPNELATNLTNVGDEAEDFSAEEFTDRIHERTIPDNTDPEDMTRAVFAVLSEHVRDEELDNMVDQLPSDYGRLLRDANIREESP